MGTVLSWTVMKSSPQRKVQMHMVWSVNFQNLHTPSRYSANSNDMNATVNLEAAFQMPDFTNTRSECLPNNTTEYNPL